MEWSFVFFLNSALLGVGLAMDAFSVSLANGLHDPHMSRRRGAIIAGTFGVFQAVMPMAGWLCVHTIVELFSAFERFVPWIALALLGYIGGKMLLEGIIIRLHANEIPVQSRYGSGVRVMRLGENAKVMVLARTDHDDEAQTETIEAEESDEPTAEQLAAMEAADEASAAEVPEAENNAEE